MQIYRGDSNGSARDDINSVITSPFCDVSYRGANFGELYWKFSHT
jgi:hypothetical protein